MSGPERRRPALAQVVEIRLASLDPAVELEIVCIAAHDDEVDRQPDAEIERIVRSIEISPTFSAS